MTETGIGVRAHAKINLSLHVTGVRPDGYHLLETVFQSLALHDTLTFEPCAGPFVLSCSAPDVPTDHRNLVWKAASAIWHAGGREGQPAGVRVHVEKHIPAQGGLGGGSADGAAALRALDALWRTGLGEPRLQALARDLGADVPFFLRGGTALGLGRGDDIHPLDDLPSCAVVLVFPPFGVSTPEAFRWWDEENAGQRDATEGGDDAAPRGLRLADGTRLRVFNALQGPVARRHPEIGQVCRALEERGADVAAMTGSGSTVFGLFAEEGRAAAAAAALGASGWRTLVSRTATRREAVQPVGAFTGRGPLV